MLLAPASPTGTRSSGRGLVERGWTQEGKGCSSSWGSVIKASLPITSTWLPTSGTAALREAGINAVDKIQKHKEGNTETQRGSKSFASTQEYHRQALQRRDDLAKHAACATTSCRSLSQLPKEIFAPRHLQTRPHGLLCALLVDTGTASGTGLAFPSSEAFSSSTAHQDQSSSKL